MPLIRVQNDKGETLVSLCSGSRLFGVIYFVGTPVDTLVLPSSVPVSKWVHEPLRR